MIRRRAQDTARVIVGDHAFDRIDERTIIIADVYRILKTGVVIAKPERTKKGEWQAIITKRMRGHREAGVITIILKNSEILFVKTVEWMDT